jgi:Zn-dependent protease with chaperone function
MEGLAALLILGGIYFLPALIAAGRKVPSAGSVFVVNLFLGWTLIGWVVALAMAVRTVPQAHLEELRQQRAMRDVKRRMAEGTALAKAQEKTAVSLLGKSGRVSG